MKRLKSILATLLSLFLAVESVPATPVSASSKDFALSIPSRLGYVSSQYRTPSADTTRQPDFIFIQDLHVNRSVQFGISQILKHLKTQGLLSSAIAVEGETGPVEIQSMQSYQDAAVRQDAADYLVQQGEMPGAMHFAVTEGEGSLYGIETKEYYQANLDMFRRSYKGRAVLRQEVENMQAVLPRLKKDAALRENAVILEQELLSVSKLINNQVTPDELAKTLASATAAVDHLKQILPNQSDQALIEPLSASINFYALALIRNEELFKNALTVHSASTGAPTVVVTGGFHTQALGELCKQRGMSYAVITPTVKVHDKADEKLYVERLLHRHLSPAQAQTGADWAAMMIQVPQRAANLFVGAAMYFSTLRRRPFPVRTIGNIAVVMACAAGLAACHGKSPTGPTDPSNPGPGIDPVYFINPPSASEGVVLATYEGSSTRLQDNAYIQYVIGDYDIRSGDSIDLILGAGDAGSKVMLQLSPFGANAMGDVGLLKQVLTVGTAERFFNASRMRLPIQRSEFGLDETSRIKLIQVISGESRSGFTLNPGRTTSVVTNRVDLIYGPGRSTAKLQTFPFMGRLVDSIFPTLSASSGEPTRITLPMNLVKMLPVRQLNHGLTLEAKVPTTPEGESQPNSLNINVFSAPNAPLNTIELEVEQQGKITVLRNLTSVGPLSALPEAKVTLATPTELKVELANPSANTVVRVRSASRFNMNIATIARLGLNKVQSFGFIALLASGLALLGSLATPAAVSAAPLVTSAATAVQVAIPAPVTHAIGFGEFAALSLAFMTVVLGIFQLNKTTQKARRDTFARLKAGLARPFKAIGQVRANVAEMASNTLPWLPRFMQTRVMDKARQVEAEARIAASA